MKRPFLIAFLLALSAPAFGLAREAKLVRYPHYHQGRVAFTYLGDIWTADENGQSVRRITAHKARDVYPRFSPDGKWIAFSSERNGNLDVFIVASEGGAAKQLTFHSADDTVQGWAPDSRSGAIRLAARRGLHGQAVHGKCRWRNASQRRFRHGSVGDLFSRWPQAGDQSPSSELLAQVLSGVVSDGRHGHGRRR